MSEKKRKKSAPPPQASVEAKSATEAKSARPLDAWSRYWLAPIAAVRPWLMRKAVLLLLAFDVLHTHLGAAWRYGAGDFNVPHFAWMHALPLPTTAAYVGMLFFVSVGAFVAAVVPRPPRALLVAIAVAYTWGWSISMLDSYQHHYFIGLALLGFALFPDLDAERLFGDAETPREAPHGLVPRVHLLAYPMLTLTAGTIYAFTAISKTEPDWVSGDAMRNITGSGETLRWAIDLAASFGVDEDGFFWLLGHGVVPAQIVCALTYWLAPLLDGASTEAERARFAELVGDFEEEGGRGSTVARGLFVGAIVGLVGGFAFELAPLGIVGLGALGAAVGAAITFDKRTWRFVLAPFGKPSPLQLFLSLGMITILSFHFGTELLDLSIGWFASYMMILAVIALAPARWLSLAAFAASRFVRTRRVEWSSPAMVVRLVLAALFGLSSLVALGVYADLPGALAASLAIALVLGALVVGSFVGQAERRDAFPFALACLAAGLLLSGWLGVSSARFDYFRFAGGDFRRRLDYAPALEAYQHANRYAPPGQSRSDRVEEMEQRLRERRGLSVDEP